MLCIKCGKDIADDSAYCNYCGHKQNAKKTKYHKRESGSGTIYQDKRYKKPWLAWAPSSKYGKGRQYIGSYATRNEARSTMQRSPTSTKCGLKRTTTAFHIRQ